AAEGGGMSWLLPHLAPNPTAESSAREVGCLLVGGRTHRGDDPHAGTDKEGAFEGTYGGPSVVLSRRLDTATVGPGTEVCSDVTTAVGRARELAGDGHVNILGATTARSCLDAG